MKGEKPDWEGFIQPTKINGIMKGEKPDWEGCVKLFFFSPDSRNKLGEKPV